MTSFVTYCTTHARQNEIYLLNILIFDIFVVILQLNAFVFYFQQRTNAAVFLVSDRSLLL